MKWADESKILTKFQNTQAEIHSHLSLLEFHSNCFTKYFSFFVRKWSIWSQNKVTQNATSIHQHVEMCQFYGIIWHFIFNRLWFGFIKMSITVLSKRDCEAYSFGVKGNLNWFVKYAIVYRLKSNRTFVLLNICSTHFLRFSHASLFKFLFPMRKNSSRNTCSDSRIGWF